jgi:hypothetical protein
MEEFTLARMNKRKSEAISLQGLLIEGNFEAGDAL